MVVILQRVEIDRRVRVIFLKELDIKIVLRFVDDQELHGEAHNDLVVHFLDIDHNVLKSLIIRLDLKRPYDLLLSGLHFKPFSVKVDLPKVNIVIFLRADIYEQFLVLDRRKLVILEIRERVQQNTFLGLAFLENRLDLERQETL